jgi:hypothetical protein
MVWKAIAMIGATALIASSVGCRVRTEKGADGEDKSVQIDTPFGGVHVNTNDTTASDLGLPTYPGAQIAHDDDKHQSADVHMGFGEWQLRVRAVPYTSTDSQDKVVAFYKKAMGRFGDVLTCEGNAPVGTPVVTAEGLDCSDSSKKTHINVDGKGNGMDDFSGALQLKAGSTRHQHIVGFETPRGGKTRFAMVAIDLPAGADGKSDKSD